MSTVQDLTIISPWKAELVKDIFLVALVELVLQVL